MYKPTTSKIKKPTILKSLLKEQSWGTEDKDLLNIFLYYD